MTKKGVASSLLRKMIDGGRGPSYQLVNEQMDISKGETICYTP